MPSLEFYESRVDQTSLVGAWVDRLVGEGFSPDEIVILSARSNEAAAASEALRVAQGERFREFTLKETGHIRYATIHAFKGMEAARRDPHGY